MTHHIPATSAVCPIVEPRSPSAAPRQLVILGATGSIGCSVARVIAGAPGRFEVVAVTGGHDAAALARVARELGARVAAIADPAGFGALREELAGSGIAAMAGAQALIDVATLPCDMVVAAIAGAAGVRPVHAALSAGRTVALANKESLVCAGTAVMAAAAASGALVLPMDSEHNAIFQVLCGHDPARLERMILTASGGPFRTWSAAQIAAATPDQALAHPQWSMGAKISVDSASLMNKGLELIEAHHLFAVPPEKLDVLVHPQSIVHGLVALDDGMVLAGLAMPDMQVPVSFCLGWPERVGTNVRRLDLSHIGTLTFDRPDLERFPALGVAQAALAAGGQMPNVLNAANEIAVAAFLAGRISFPAIAQHVAIMCDTCAPDVMTTDVLCVEDALGVDHIIRKKSYERLNFFP